MVQWSKAMSDLGTIKQRLSNELARGHAVVFIATVDQLQDFRPILTASERIKFDKVRLPIQRRLHALGRGLVRYFFDLPSDDLAVSSAGKPEAVGAASFNISHTGHSIVVAAHQRCPIGVDIEAHQRDVQDDALIARVCHPQEARWIMQKKGRSKTQAFLRCWVRKEAILKAQGTGLVDDLHMINTCLQNRFVVLQVPEQLRVWDFPPALCADHGALATSNDVSTVCYLSPATATSQHWPLQSAGLLAGLRNDRIHDDYI